MIIILIVSESILVPCGNKVSTILAGFIPYAQGFISFACYYPCNITSHLTYHSSYVPLNGFLGVSENWIAVMIFDFIFLLIEIISLAMFNQVTVTFL